MGNRVARLLKAAAWIIFALWTAAAIYHGITVKYEYSYSPFNIVAALPEAAGAFLIGLFFYALGEIIGILHDIRDGVTRSSRMESLSPFSNRWRHEPAGPGAEEQAETFLWSCIACGEMNLSGSDTCRKCEAARQ